MAIVTHLKDLLIFAANRAGPIPLTLLVLICGFAYSLQVYWSVGDDHLNFFMTGRAITNKSSVDHLLDQSIATFEVLGFREGGIEEIAVRQKNILTYLLPSALYAAAAASVEALSATPIGIDYGRYLVLSSLLGYVVSFLVAAALFCLSLSYCPRALQIQTFLALVATFLLLILMPDSGYFSLGDGFLGRLPLAILSPGPAYGLFGITPRNNFVLLALATFVLRMSGRYGAAYALMMLATLFHRQQGALLLVLLLLVDLVMRPRALAHLRIAIWPTLGLCYFAAMETLWTQMGVSRLAGLSVVIGFALVAGGLACRSAWLASEVGKSQTLLGFGAGLLGLDRLFRDDRTVILCAWLGVVSISLVASSIGIRGAYFWDLLPARLLMIIQPLLVLTVVQLTARRLGDSGPFAPVVYETLAAVGKGLGALSLAIGLIYSCTLIARTAEQTVPYLRQFGLRLAIGISPTVSYRDEKRLYYAIVRSVDTGSDHFEDLISTTRSPRFDDLMTAIALNDRRLFDREIEQAELLDKPFAMPTPWRWPRPVIEVTPYVGALIWDRTDMSEAIAARLDDALRAPALSTLCETIARGNNRLLDSLSLMMASETLDRPCPRIPGLIEAPPICILRSLGHSSAAHRLVEAGASIDPLGGCPR